ncbi:MAG: matrixin family metalloprotease [Chitinophagaceae bacterium]|nr:matrixin family metalloprotease [Oligoflexus sp.]
MLRMLLCLTLASVTVACGSANGTRRSISETTSQTANSSGSSTSGFHSLTGWQKTVPFYISSQASDEVVEAAQNAAATWGDAVGQVALKFAGIGTSTRGKDLYASLDDNKTFVYYEDNWTTTTGKSTTTLATTVWENATDSDRIVSGDVILNSQTYTFLDALKTIPKGVNETRVVDAETVLLHEFGHLLGLDHISESTDSDSIMHAKTFIGPGLSFRTLSDGDTSNIKKLYP